MQAGILRPNHFLREWMNPCKICACILWSINICSIQQLEDLAKRFSSTADPRRMCRIKNEPVLDTLYTSSVRTRFSRVKGYLLSIYWQPSICGIVPQISDSLNKFCTRHHTLRYLSTLSIKPVQISLVTIMMITKTQIMYWLKMFCSGFGQIDTSNKYGTS